MSSDPTLSAFDFDAPDTPRDERLAAVRALLTRRLNTSSTPSRLVNQLYATQERCLHTTRQLGALAVRAPRILTVIRHALREAFGLDPDTLLFHESPSPERLVNSLTDRALNLFRDPGVPINLHHFTALSLRDEPGRVLPFNATQAMARVSQLELAVRVNRAMRDYWQGLANGSWLSRLSRWAEWRQALFADQSYLAFQLFQLSSAGYAMARQLVDAPTAQARQRAGGSWATLQVRRVAWPHSGNGSLEIPGALHLYRDGAADGPQVVYLPGLQRGFHEFPSWHQLQVDLPGLVLTSLFSLLWHYLPFKREAIAPLSPGALLKEDALAYSAQALLDSQWNCEWGGVLSLDYTAPSLPGMPLPSHRAAQLLRYLEKGRKRLGIGLPFETSLDELLEWDRRRRQSQIMLGSLSPDLPRKDRQVQVRRYEAGLQALLAGNDQAYQALLQVETQRQEQIQSIARWTQAEAGQLFQVTFWLERPDGTHKRASLVLNAQRRALRQAAQLEHRLNRIKQAHLDRLLEVLGKPLASERALSDTRVLRVAISKGAHTVYGLMGVFVVTTARALAEHKLRQPVVLVVGGEFGGLAVFEHLNDLSQRLRASLASPDGSVLWRCIGRDVRAAAQFALARSMQVDYSVAQQDVLYEDFKALVEHHARLNKRLDEPGRLFSEVSDAAVGRLLLAQELREHLQAPANEMMMQALANVDFMRFGAERAKSRPAWLVGATRAQYKNYRRLQRRYASSAMALESRLWQILPPLYGFARERLIAQLTQDGFYPGLDVDAPLLDMPDDVSAHLCGWSSQCVVGDRSIKKTVSPERSTFSLLELALHNLDPQAPWTEWRLNRARYLQPAWKDRLNPRYLIKTLSAIDIGGRYDGLIKSAFASAPSGLPRELIDRATLHMAQMQVFSAARQGLSSEAHSLFNTAMVTRSEAINLGFVRLRGYTMAHDRHVAGLLVIFQPGSARCLVYWPDAMGYPVLAEHGSVEQAREHLNRRCAAPEILKALARRVAPGWEDEALASYPGQRPLTKGPVTLLTWISPKPIPGYAVLKIYEAIRRFVRSFKVKHAVPAAALPAIEMQIKEQIDAEPLAWLDIVPTSHSDALALLAHARMLEVQQRAHARATSSATLAQYREQRLSEQWDATVRGLLSFVPVLGVGISLYEMLLAARRYHLEGRPEDAVDVAFLTLMAFIDVLTAFSPFPKAGNAGALRRSLAQLHKKVPVRLPPAVRPSVLLARYKKPFSTHDAVPLQGPGEKGLYAKNGELFFADGEHRLAVYRRRDDASLRVKGPGDGAEGELVLTIRQDREWSLGADAPPPEAGPSLGELTPWRAPVTPPPDWWPPLIRTATENRIVQSSVATTQWLEWRIQIPVTPQLNSPAPGVFHVPVNGQGFAFNALRIAPPNTSLSHPLSAYYRLIPQGRQAPLNRIVFISRNEPPVSLAGVDIERWTTTARGEQPIPASRTPAGEWRMHAPLFDRPLTEYVGQAFPGMTPKTREFTVARIVELADPSRVATATHLLNIRATLDGWLPPLPAKPGQTSDLLRMLRATQRGQWTTFIGYQGAAPGFTRVDFVPPHPLVRVLHRGGEGVAQQRGVMQRAAVKQVLEAQGFTVREFRVQRRGVVTQEGIATHPHSPNVLYYLAYEWFEKGHLRIRNKMTDDWFAAGTGRHMDVALSTEINSALREQRLVRILTGIQWPVTGDVSASVYFVKLTP